MSRTPGLYERAAGLSKRLRAWTLAVGLGVMAAVTLPAREPGMVSPELVAGFFTGALHLALAEGRLACATPDLPFSDGLRQLTATDVHAARVAIDALPICQPTAPAPTAVVATDTGARDGWPTLVAARGDIAQLRDEYVASEGRSICLSLPPGERLDTISTAAFAIGSAAARTQCAISTWKGPLPAETAHAVRADLGAVRSALGALHGLSTSTALRARLAAVTARLEGERGEEVYEQVMALAEALGSALLQAGSDVPSRQH